MAKKKNFDQFKREESVRLIPVDLIDPNPANPNEMNDRTFERLVNELREAGRLIEPIQVVPKNDDRFMILGGEHRYKAAKILGWTEIPATLLTEERWNDRDLVQFVGLRMNLIKGSINPEKMARLYTEMADKYGADSLKDLMGFTDEDAWNKLVKGVNSAIKKSLPKAIADKFDAKTKDMQVGQDLGLIINQLMAEYGDTVNESFMVFSHGSRSHIYVGMSNSTHDSMKKVLGYCKKYNKDINDVIADITLEWVKKANAEAKAAEKAKKEGAEEDPPVDLNVTGVDF